MRYCEFLLIRRALTVFIPALRRWGKRINWYLFRKCGSPNKILPFGAFVLAAAMQAIVHLIRRPVGI